MAEIGCYEGRSSRWYVENVLTGPGAALVCLDIWPAHAPDIEAHFDYNTRDLRALGKLVKI
jgi:hypothetical protein